MKIVENTDRRLVIEHRPWLLAGFVWFMGLIALYSGVTGVDMDGLAERLLALALGIGMTFAAWYWFAFLRITFDRDTGTIEHQSLRPFGSRSKFLDLAAVQGARLQVEWNENTRMTRLVIETSDGPAVLEYGFGAGDRTVLEAAVNEWLTRPG